MASNVVISSDSSGEESESKRKNESTSSSQRCSEPAQTSTAKRVKLHRKKKNPGSGV